MPRLLRSIFSKTVGATVLYLVGEITAQPPQNTADWLQLGGKLAFSIAARDAVNKVQDAAARR